MNFRGLDISGLLENSSKIYLPKDGILWKDTVMKKDWHAGSRYSGDTLWLDILIESARWEPWPQYFSQNTELCKNYETIMKAIFHRKLDVFISVKTEMWVRNYMQFSAQA